MWEKVKGAARIAWIIVQIISIPIAVVGTLFMLGILPRKPKPGSGGDNGGGTGSAGSDLHGATDAEQRITAISDRFGKLLAEGRDIIARIRDRENKDRAE